MIIKRHAHGTGSYIISADGRNVGEVAKTGTHLDHYPWDWMLLDGIEPHIQKNGYRYKTTGAAETLRQAVDEIAAAIGFYAFKEED